MAGDLVNGVSFAESVARLLNDFPGPARGLSDWHCEAPPSAQSENRFP